MWQTNPRLRLDVQGLDLCERYYRKVGRPKLLRCCPELEGRFAAGVVGDGSECFGFDDAISTDHDWGPSFCIWLEDDELGRFGAALQKAYESLPEDFEGRSFAYHKAQAAGRRGILGIGRFYGSYLGRATPPTANLEWLQLPEGYLATATNGRVFEDGPGTFTAIREALLAFYPEDVRRKKVAARLVSMAHSGQANFCRVMARFDTVAASAARNQFLDGAMRVIYLLNRRYAPYYKWTWRGIAGLERLSDLSEPLRLLAEAPLVTDAWLASGGDVSLQPPNTKDRCVELIERICARVVEELRVQGLSSEGSYYLEPHAYAVQGSITDPEIRRLPVMRG